MKRISIIIAAIACAFFLNACATDDRVPAGGIAYQYEPDETTRQNPNSYFMDGFNIPKDRPSRSSSNRMPFFYKHCDQGSGRSPWSETTYSCNDGM